MAKKTQRPVIEHYTDYRAFLRDVLDWKKNQPGKYSFQKFSEESGVGSPALLNMVLSGKRNLSPDAVKGVGKALGLTGGEVRFLKKLVEMDRVADPVAKQQNLRQLARRAKFRERFQIDADQLDYLSSWYILAIHEMVDFPSFKADPQWISEQLLPNVSPKQAREALELLERLGLIAVQTDGKVVRTVHRVETPDELVHDLVRGYHAQATELARWAVANLDASDRNFGVVTGRVTPQGMREILSRLYRIRDELADLFGELETTDGDIVLQVNVQGFPVTRFGEGKP